MATYEIPLSAEGQTFAIALGGVTYQLTLVYRDAAGGGWVLDIADAQGVALLRGVPLVTGADLLAQHRALGFVGSLVVQTDHNPDAAPTFENLGSTSHLYFVTT